MKSSLHSLIHSLPSLLNHLRLQSPELDQILDNYSNVKVTLRMTVTQSVGQYWCRALFGAHDQIFITVRQLHLFTVGRPLWREDGSVFVRVIVCSSKSFVIMWRIFTFYILNMLKIYIKYIQGLCQSRLSKADYTLFLIDYSNDFLCPFITP
jgi:hypothetical protein